MAHSNIRPYNTRDTHPDEPDVHYDNELCQTVIPEAGPAPAESREA